MKHHTMSALVVFLLGLLATGRTNPLIDYIEDSNNRFALDFYQAIRNNTGNVFASSISLKMLLALVRLGAEGDTAAEMSNVLHHPRDNLTTFDAYRALINELKNPVLKIANKVFVDNRFNIKNRFIIEAMTYFLSHIQAINFSGDPDGSRKRINAWVARNTNYKIKDFFKEGSLMPAPRLILVNAIHFKAKWMHEFKEEFTEDALFYIAPRRTVKVNMMSLINEELFYKNSARLDAQVVEIPYEMNTTNNNEKDFRMILILPNKYDGLPDVESKLDSSDMLTELRGLSSIRANVQMPRFKLEQELDLEKILQKLGMLKAFSNQAEFSKMSNGPLKIDRVIQKAFIEVNEEGTEAAAATATVVIGSPSPHTAKNIRFDHPFMFLIMKNSTILFMGRLSNPK